MVRQSRLRVQQGRKRKRALLLVLVVALVAVAVWQINKNSITSYITKSVLTVKKSLYKGKVPSRGTIYDRNLQQVAVTLERVSVYVRIKEIESITETVEELSAILPIDRGEVKKTLETGPLRVWITEDISQEEEIALKKKQIPGVYLQHEKVRFYPNGTYAAHLVGYVDDNIGLSGVEFFYDRLLANSEAEGGPAGDFRGQSRNLVLTIDLKIQKIVEDLVADIGSWRTDTRVAAFVVEGRTGEIVAGAQFPGFNPNNFKQYSQKVLEDLFLQPTAVPEKFRRFLRDVAGVYSVLDSGLTLHPWSVQSARNNLGCQLRLWEWLRMTEQWSTDFSEYDRDVKKRETVYRPFLFARDESCGLVPEYATPLKIITAFVSIFSGGTRIKPHAVSTIIDPENKKEYKLPIPGEESEGLGRIIRKGEKEVTQLLRSTAVAGSSGTLFLDDENILVASTGKGDSFLRSEMLFALIPADISPLTMLVVVEGRAELPPSQKSLQPPGLLKRVDRVVDRISVLQQVARNVADVVEIEVRDETNYPFEKSAEAGSSKFQTTGERVLSARGRMPDLRGLSLRRSLQLLQNSRIKIRFQGTGRVVSQTPAAGTSLTGLTECILILENVEEVKFDK